MSRLLFNLDQQTRVVEQLDVLDVIVQETVDARTNAVSDGGKILLCCNGALAADCQHIATEFVGHFMDELQPLTALVMGAATAALSRPIAFCHHPRLSPPYAPVHEVGVAQDDAQNLVRDIGGLVVLDHAQRPLSPPGLLRQDV